jgi:hypothetical protein
MSMVNILYLKVDGPLNNKKSYPEDNSLVGRVGVEPTQPLGRQILSLLRLPIPPPPRIPYSN